MKRLVVGCMMIISASISIMFIFRAMTPLTLERLQGVWFMRGSTAIVSCPQSSAEFIQITSGWPQDVSVIDKKIFVDFGNWPTVLGFFYGTHQNERYSRALQHNYWLSITHLLVPYWFLISAPACPPIVWLIVAIRRRRRS